MFRTTLRAIVTDHPPVTVDAPPTSTTTRGTHSLRPPVLDGGHPAIGAPPGGEHPAVGSGSRWKTARVDHQGDTMRPDQNVDASTGAAEGYSR